MLPIRSSSKLPRIEALCRILALVILVASAIGNLRHADARWTLGASIALGAWITISTTGARLGIGRGVLAGWWVVAIDLLILGVAVVSGRHFLDELAAAALALPIGVMTLRGKVQLSVLAAVGATVIAALLSWRSLDQPETSELIAHIFAWAGIFGMVSISSRAGYRFLQVADLEEGEADRRLEALLVRAPEAFGAASYRLTVRLATEIAREVFEAESASLMVPGQAGMRLAGLSRQARYVDPTEEEVPGDEESASRVTIADFVAYSGQPILLDAMAHRDPRFRNLKLRGGVHSAMCVPVQLGSRRMGVLNVTRLDESQPKFTASDLRVARVLAYVVAIALSRHSG